jgi:hypothetical protein
VQTNTSRAKQVANGSSLYLAHHPNSYFCRLPLNFNSTPERESYCQNRAETPIEYLQTICHRSAFGILLRSDWNVAGRADERRSDRLHAADLMKRGWGFGDLPPLARCVSQRS